MEYRLKLIEPIELQNRESMWQRLLDWRFNLSYVQLQICVATNPSKPLSGVEIHHTNHNGYHGSKPTELEVASFILGRVP